MLTRLLPSRMSATVITGMNRMLRGCKQRDGSPLKWELSGLGVYRVHSIDVLRMFLPQYSP